MLSHGEFLQMFHRHRGGQSSADQYEASCAVECGTTGAVLEHVELAYSDFQGSKEWLLMGYQAYHTSLLLAGVEFYFDPGGVQAKSCVSCGVPASHVSKTNTRVIKVGLTRHNGQQLRDTVGKHFLPGSYDVVAKNCNAFTDCALAYLISRRLPKKFRSVEIIAQGLPSVLSLASGGKYKANPYASGFDLEALIFRLDENAMLGTTQALGNLTNSSVSTPRTLIRDRSRN